MLQQKWDATWACYKDRSWPTLRTLYRAFGHPDFFLAGLSQVISRLALVALPYLTQKVSDR